MSADALMSAFILLDAFATTFVSALYLGVRFVSAPAFKCMVTGSAFVLVLAFVFFLSSAFVLVLAFVFFLSSA